MTNTSDCVMGPRPNGLYILHNLLWPHPQDQRSHNNVVMTIFEIRFIPSEERIKCLIRHILDIISRCFETCWLRGWRCSTPTSPSSCWARAESRPTWAGPAAGGRTADIGVEANSDVHIQVFSGATLEMSGKFFDWFRTRDPILVLNVKHLR